MSAARTLILDHTAIEQKLKRIAFQLYEYNHNEGEVVFVAIEKQGRLLAEQLKPILEACSGLNVELLTMKLDKKSLLKEAAFNGNENSLVDKSVILIDDVLNSGRTLMYAAKHILNYPVKKLTTVVLVDRRHRQFPIKADFAGLSLSTTLQNHISVVFEDGNNAAYLE